MKLKCLAVKIIAALTVAALCAGAVLAETAEIAARDYLGEWVDLDGKCSIDIEAGEDIYIANVRLDVSDGDDHGYRVFAYGCVYDEDARALKSLSRVTAAGDDAPGSQETVTGSDYSYSGALFSFDDAGQLIWNDGNEDADDDMAFTRAVGRIDGEHAGPGHRFAGKWNDGRVSIEIIEDPEAFLALVRGSGSAFDGALWVYTCDYDPETDSLVSNGETAARIDYAYDEDGNYSEARVYDDGAAVFSLNGDGLLIWVDQRENAGEGRLFQRVPADEAAFDLHVVTPVYPDCDLTALADGVYAAAFEPSDLADDKLTFSVYTQDVYDLADLSGIAAGDLFCAGGEFCVVQTVEWDGDLLINGGLNGNGFTLCPYEADNCWKVVMENDHNTYTCRGGTTLPLDAGAVFTDGWDIEREPVTVSGAEAVAEAVNGTAMDYFGPLNTTVRVQDGRVAGMVRAYMP